MGVKPKMLWKSTSPTARIVVIMCSAEFAWLSMLMPSASATSV